MNVSKKELFYDDSDDNVEIKTENEYAKKYDSWREKEELHKLEQKYGPQALGGDAGPAASSGSDDDSDDSLQVTEQMEEQFLKTLSMLKSKDQRIYDPQYQFFEEDVDKEDGDDSKRASKTVSFADSDDDGDGEDDGNIFKVEKRAAETMASRVEARNAQGSCESTSKSEQKLLTAQPDGGAGRRADELAPLRALWSDPAINESEAFLRDYILQKRYLEAGDGGGWGDGGGGGGWERLRDDEALEEDERRVEEQRQFERAYNFRFEEPDTEYLKRFPRTMNYIRPKDERRARKRAEVRARKEDEKKKKMEEIARMKALKLKEIQDKIAKIKEVTGNQDLAFQEEDVEGEFDPAAHDRRMRALFDDRYYGQPDAHKPRCPHFDDELEIESWERYESGDAGAAAGPREGEVTHCEDDDFNMDADFVPATLLEHIQDNLAKKRRSRKKKSKLAQLLSQPKPRFVPRSAAAEPEAGSGRSYAQHMDEYYAMDCEDVIAGELPTRFKYRRVVPNDYGLTVEEILLADDKELTQWAPLKKILKYRPEHAERDEAARYTQRARDAPLKRRLLPSLFHALPEEPEIVARVGETKKKKKKKNTNEGDAGEGDHAATTKEGGDLEGGSQSGQNKKKKRGDNGGPTTLDNDTTSQETNVDKGKSNGFTVEVVASEATRPCLRGGNDDVTVERKADDGPHIVPKERKIKSDSRTAPRKNKSSRKNRKHYEKVKHKLQNDRRGAALGQLSDGRLRAYGLRPKKYRGFLKYRKF